MKYILKEVYISYKTSENRSKMKILNADQAWNYIHRASVNLEVGKTFKLAEKRRSWFIITEAPHTARKYQIL